MMINRRNKRGGVIAEVALAMPIFLFLILALVELGRALYIQNALGLAARETAKLIGINARRGNTYNVSGFGTFASQVRFQGAVVSNSQFSFDVRDVSNNSTVMNGQANSSTSTKVIVTVSFPPAGRNNLKVPLFDLGNLIGTPIFGQNGLQLSSSATAFLERSRRPIIN